MVLTVLLQAAEAEVASLNLLEMALKGGWIMIPLLLLGIIAVYIFIERLLVIRKASYKDTTFMNKIKDYINEGKIDAALTLCKNTDTPYSRMIEKGITRLGRPMNDVMVAIENVGNLEIAKLEPPLYRAHKCVRKSTWKRRCIQPYFLFQNRALRKESAYRR